MALKSKTSSTPVESKTAAAPVVVAPVAAAPQKGGKKTAVKADVPAVVAAPVAAPKVVAKKVKAQVAALESKVAPVAPVVAAKGKGKKAEVVAPVQKAGAKKEAAPKAEKVEKAVKAPKVVKAKKEVVETAEDAEGDDAKGVRSFKVQLPGNEEYTGRFTGLTPYQAANKALSKFFRENKTAKSEISFSIRESTRGSKRSTYTYNGKREKLDVPVKYSIKSPDGVAREIVKEYKNKLIKVKKADVKAAAAAAPVATA